jgi:guanyl-specific ribonuclease Sa
MRRAVLLVALGALLVGCGDDEGSTTVAGSTDPGTTTTSNPPAPTTSSTRDESTTTAEDAPAGATDPVIAATAVLTSEGTTEEACRRDVTENFIETAYGGTENCIASRTDRALAQGLSLGTAIEEGATHLVVIPQGGPYDGAKVEVELVREGDAYLVDSLKAHVPAGP